MDADSRSLWNNTFFFTSVILIFLNWWKEWELPWVVIAFLVFVAIRGAVDEGGGSHPHHD